MDFILGYSSLMAHFNTLLKDPLFILYVAAVLSDLLLGNVKAWSLHIVDSDVGLKGTLKHGGIFMFVVIMLPPLTYYLGNPSVSMSILAYLVYQYMISIIENLGQLGYKVPKVFEERLRKIEQQEVDWDK